MTTNKIIGALVNTQNQVDQLSRAGLHACGGTFRHSTAQSILTTGTALTFDTEIRNSGLTVDATNKQFTVNTGGMFVISLSFLINLNVNFIIRMEVNGINTNIMDATPTGLSLARTAMIMKYLQKNHVLSFTAFTATNCSILPVTEDATNESPILQICQVSPKFKGS